MNYRSIGASTQIVESDYYKADLVLASEMLIKETMAIKDADEYILVNDDNVDYYSVVDKNGVKSLIYHAAKVGLGTLAGTLVKRKYGGGTEEKLIFIKMKNSKRLLIIVPEGQYHLIRSKNKRPKDEISKEDMKWIEQALDKNDIELI